MVGVTLLIFSIGHISSSSRMHFLKAKHLLATLVYTLRGYCKIIILIAVSSSFSCRGVTVKLFQLMEQ